jgi:hypothetical protein
MPTNLKQFVLEVEKGPQQKRLEKHLVNFHKAVHFEAQKRIVKRTPRDTGLTRQHWQSTLLAPASGNATGKQGIEVLSGLRPYSVSYITNNRDHILVLEDGGFEPPDPGPSKDKRKGRKGRVLVRGGYSVQAPHGMVAITVAELRGLTKG